MAVEIEQDLAQRYGDDRGRVDVVRCECGEALGVRLSRNGDRVQWLKPTTINYSSRNRQNEVRITCDRCGCVRTWRLG